MRKGNKLIQEGKVPKKRTLNTQVLTDIVNGYYLDGIEAGYKAGYDYGYEVGKKDYDQNNKQFDLGYQQGLEDGRKQGVAIDGDKRYWDGYHAAQEDGKKIYQKGYEDGAKCQDEVQYQKGLEDAWAAARKIILGSEKGGMVGLPFDNCFKDLDYFDCDDLLYRYSASEVIEKIRAYEEKQKQEEARSGYVECDDPIKSEKTVYPDSPCDLCRFNPPSVDDGKPCTMCPAEGKVEE